MGRNEFKFHDTRNNLNATYQRIKHKLVILISMRHQNCKQRIKSIRQELKQNQSEAYFMKQTNLLLYNTSL